MINLVPCTRALIYLKAQNRSGKRTKKGETETNSPVNQKYDVNYKLFFFIFAIS